MGAINFSPISNAPLTSSIYSVSPGVTRFSLNFEIDRYQEIIETFRYEKPIFVTVAWDANFVVTDGYVSTNYEPVGEQEKSFIGEVTGVKLHY